MSLPLIPGATFQLLVELLEGTQIMSRASVFSIGVLVYDYILTFTDEMTYVWSSRWNTGKVLFLLTRYSPFLDALTGLMTLSLNPPSSVQVCRRLTNATAWLETFGTLIAKAILLLRTRAIWGNDNRVFIPLLIIYILLLIGAIVPLQMFLASQNFIPLFIWPHCQVFSRKNIVVLSFASGLLFETIVMVFTGIKAFQHWRLGSGPLLYVVYRDGFLFYIYFVSVNLATILPILIVHKPVGAIMITLNRVLSAILSARLLINMRKAAVSARMRSGSTTLAASEGIELTTLNVSGIMCESDPAMSGHESVFVDDGRDEEREFESVSWWMGEDSVANIR